MGGDAFVEHVENQPAVVRALIGTDVPRLDPGRPVVLTGIGTSLHACKVAAWWASELSSGRVRPAVLDAHDLALHHRLRSDDQVVVVSHRGTKRYPNAVLAAAREAGASTTTITGLGGAEPEADVVLRTCEQERASTHSVSYTAALTVLAKLVATLDEEGGALLTALEAVPDAMNRTLALPLAAAAVEALARSQPHTAMVCGTHLDALTAEEAALKLKEGTYRWTEALHGEFALHGTPAVFSSRTTGYLIRPAVEDGGRHEDLRRVLSGLGASSYVCADDPGADLPFAEVHPLARPFVAILPFHRLVGDVARALGADPDLTHMEAEPWGSVLRTVSL